MWNQINNLTKKIENNKKPKLMGCSCQYELENGLLWLMPVWHASQSKHQASKKKQTTFGLDFELSLPHSC